METPYDFIVVGAGASGSVVASRLAHTSSRPSVLLLEAGDSTISSALSSSAERYQAAFTPNSPFNWHYKTTPQNQLIGQEINYSRGKGLGGSTAINFCAWVVGPRDDYDQWARVTGDESFSWQNVKRCLQNIENLHVEIPNPKLKKFVDPKIKDHSTSGSVHLTYGDSWLSDVGDIFLAAEQSRLPTNQDVNSGNPIGMGLGSMSIYKGQRVTAADAYLLHPPPNLTIVSNAVAAKIICKDKKAVGVKTVDGRGFYARKEVIVSAGALNTPQILMLSGIGSQEELKQHEIPVIHDLPMVGKNLQDHCFSSVGIVMTRDENTPPNGQRQSPTPMGWFKLPSVLSSSEYKSLPQDIQDFLQEPTVPLYEIATHTPSAFLSYSVPDDAFFLGAICLVMNPQSRGTVTLRSADPAEPPLIDPKFLTHPFDCRVMIDGIRETQRMFSAPVFATKTIEKLGPENDSDEIILDYVRQRLSSSWHMSCTVRMGTSSEIACVDSSFRVFGIEALRVVDLSVCPFLPNNHTQSTAFILGEIAAEKLIKEYALSRDDTLSSNL